MEERKLQTNSLLLGDCLELMNDIPDGSIDMILCDLPYGTTRNAWDTIIPFDRLWEHYNRVIKDNGAIVLFAQTPFSNALGASNMSMLRYEWIWKKKQATGHLNSKKMPLKAHENILVFYKKLPTYNPQGLINTVYPKINKSISGCGSNYGKADKSTAQWYENYPTDVLEFESDRDGLHPTQKPVALCEYLIKTYTNEGEVVLDNCGGSGTTAIACINTNRRYILMEKTPDIYDIAKRRIDNHLGVPSDISQGVDRNYKRFIIEV